MMDFKKIKQFKFHILCKVLDTKDNSEGERSSFIDLCVEDRPFSILEAIALFRKMQNEGELINYTQHCTYGNNSKIEIQEILELQQIDSGTSGMIASKIAVPESLPIDEILLKTK